MADSGYPDDNPKTQFGLKKIPMHLVPPVAVAQLALAFENGAGKYGPFNWREKTISSTVYYGAAMRHLLAWFDGEDFAPDSQVHHLAHVMACCAMVLDGMSIEMLNDNRPPKGALPEFLTVPRDTPVTPVTSASPCPVASSAPAPARLGGRFTRRFRCSHAALVCG